MRDFYGIDMHFTCWQKAIAKWPVWAWHALGRASAGDAPCQWAAIDGTTLARSNPSQHYYRHILGGKTARPIQQVVMIDVHRRKFLSWRVRARPRGEKCDVPYLFAHAATKPGGVLMDKGFDAEWIHEWFDQRGVWSIAPTRKGCRRGRHRKILRDCFDYELYWQRSIVEALIGAVKRLFGGHVRSRTWRTQRAEINSKLIAYNIGAKKPTIC
ncbi:MAG: transposase [Nanoarchaeota archaeon]